MKPDSPFAHAKHVFRAGFLFFLGVVGLIVLRSVLAPPTWGEYGPYRGDSVREYHVLPVMHGGNAACAECHEDVVAEHDAGYHVTVDCEVCHAPVASHAVDGTTVAEMPVHKSASLCLGCHQELTARPDAFPQIRPAEHLEEMGGEPGEQACFECHNPHSPL